MTFEDTQMPPKDIIFKNATQKKSLNSIKREKLGKSQWIHCNEYAFYPIFA